MFTYKKIIIVSSLCFVTTIIFGFAAYQSIFQFFVRDQISLHQNNRVRQFYLKFPIALDFRVNFFNVTNPNDVQKGFAPIVKELGPYCYDLYKERIDVFDNETADTLTYTPHDLYVFNEERSGNLSQNDVVTILHPLIVGMVNYVTNKSPKLLPVLNKALEFMFPDTKSMYLTAKVREILFDGVLINCSSSDFAAGAVCSQLQSQMTGIVEDGADLRYGLLRDKNGTMPFRITVNRGIQQNEALGKLLSVNNKTKGDFWGNEDCDQFRGTDGWIYPPFLGLADRIWIHPTDLCLNLHADFVERTISNDIPVRKFYSDFNLECINCTSQNCPPHGFIDLSRCVHVPLYLSLPHFLHSEQTTLAKVRGMDPDVEKHITRILLEETISLPMEAQIRLQFNFPIKPNRKISLMEFVPEVIHPILWIEVGVIMNGWMLAMVKMFHHGLIAMEVIKYILLLASLAGIVFGYYLYRKNRKFYAANKSIDLKAR